MSNASPERGGAKGAVLCVVAAGAVVGVTALFMNGGFKNDAIAMTSQPTGVVAAAVNEPVVEAQPVADPAAPAAANAEDGELIQYRDQFGEVRYRLKDKINGVLGNGQPIQWRAEMHVASGKLEKGGSPKKEFAKKKGGVKPQVFKDKDGKLKFGPSEGK